MARGCTQPGLIRWGWILIPHQQNCSDTVVFNSWRLYFMAFKICYSHAPKSCHSSMTFSPLTSFLCITVLQSNGFVNCQVEFLNTLEGNPSSSSKYLEIWLWVLPLEKFLAFVWDNILVFYDTSDTSPPLPL